MDRDTTAKLIIRLGVVFAFLYAAISGYLYPESWIGYFPGFLRENLSQDLLITGWGLFEIVIALWILSNKKIFIPSVLASLSLAGLIVFNWNLMDVIFRDVTILAATIALAIWSYPRKNYLR